MSQRVLTGRTVFLITASAFAVIITVNLTLAFQAVRTFPGLEVQNSYVASQDFDRKRKAQESLGWTARAGIERGELRLVLTGPDGLPVVPARMAVTIGRATERADDRRPDLAFDGAAWSAPVELARGYWNLWVEAEAADGTGFSQRLQLLVDG